MKTRVTSRRPDSIVIDILGTKWIITWKTPEEDAHLVQCDGYADATTKMIIIKWFEWDSMNYNDMAVYNAKVVRHEMIHAMLMECGLDINTTDNWARNEEMIDWIAIMLPKMQTTIMPVSKKVCENLTEILTTIE